LNHPYQYKPLFTNKKDAAIRHILSLLLAVLFALIEPLSIGSAQWFIKVLYVFLLVASIWNINILLIDFIDRRWFWQNALKFKIFINLFIAIIWPTLVSFLFNLFVYPVLFGKPCEIKGKENITMLIISVSMTLMINAIYSAMSFFKFWQYSIKQAESFKRESLRAEFETLKNQINPHFLFNSLNTLTTLIEENNAMASTFVTQLASVYRYVLTQKDKELSPLSDEIAFINSYIYLNRIRFGDNLITEINIPDSNTNHQIATLAIQMLVENCIKHNIISKKYPLKIQIFIHSNKLIVKNNKQKKHQAAESTGIGLTNIIHRYSYLTTETVDIEENESEFYVSLPLIVTKS